MSLPAGVTSPPPSVPNVLVSFPIPRVLLVTLNRPKQLNAIPSTSHALFDALWRWYDAQPALRCAILTGTGRAFCAGADLKEWNVRNEGENTSTATPPPPTTTTATAPPPPQQPTGTKMGVQSGFAGLSNRGGKKPVLAAVNGLCLGGGMEVALNCDMVLAAEGAVFGLPEVRRGVVALAGALPRLARVVGRQRAAEMALLGRMYGAAEMAGWGLVNKVVPEREGERDGQGEGMTPVLAEAVRWAREMVEVNSPDSVIVSREGLRLGWEPLGVETATEMLERGMYGRMDKGENMVEGVMAFVERRTPAWRDSKL